MTPYEGQEPYIFVSYAHKDSEWVLPTINALAKSGFRIWYDEGIEFGSEWPSKIGDHLSNASIVFAFITPNSIKSKNCMKEINMADDCNKQIVAIYSYKGMDIPNGLRLQIGSVQSVYYDRYPSFSDFVETLVNARELSACKATTGRAQSTTATYSQQPRPQPVRQTPSNQSSATSTSYSSSSRTSPSKHIDYEAQGKGVVIGLLLLAIAVIGLVLIFLSRELALVGLILLIGAALVSVIMAFTKYLNALIYCVMAGSIVLSFVAGYFYFSVWGTSPVAVDLDGNTVVYKLDRTDGALTAARQEGAYILKEVNAPNADPIYIEDGYTEIAVSAFASCKDMKTLYIPSSVTSVDAMALSGKTLNTVYIGYEPDGTRSETAPALDHLAAQVFLGSEVETVYYNGTVAEWNAIDKPQSVLGWGLILGEFKVICNDGTVEYD